MMTTSTKSALTVVIPGDELGTVNQYEGGPGTYIKDNTIYASLLGIVQILPSSSSSSSLTTLSSTTTLSESSSFSSTSSSSTSASDTANTLSSLPVIIVLRDGIEGNTAIVPEVGDIVVARVVRLTNQVAYCDILLCNNVPLGSSYTAILRKEHIRETEIDKVRMDECVRPGDLVSALVASMGDSRSLFLSTIDERLGVIYAKSEHTKQIMKPYSWEEMIDPSTGIREKRKVAKVIEEKEITGK